MTRQLVFLGVGLLLIIARWVDFLPLGWLIALLALLFLLWFPLRGQVEFTIDEQIVATVYWLPLPFWKIPLLGFSRPYQWWKTLGEDLERIQRKQKTHNPAEQKENASHQGNTGAVEGASLAMEPEKEETSKSGSKVDAQLVAKALRQVSIQRLQCHLTLGGSPFVAALAGGSIQMVIGWAATVLSAHAQHFPQPDVKITLDPAGHMVQGWGILRLKTDFAGAITVGVSLLAERRRKRNGGKSD